MHFSPSFLFSYVFVGIGSEAFHGVGSWVTLERLHFPFLVHDGMGFTGLDWISDRGIRDIDMRGDWTDGDWTSCHSWGVRYQERITRVWFIMSH